VKLKISVIIPTRNRAAYLRDALASIAAQDLDADAFEVVVVDNGSTDNTVEVAHSFEGKIRNLKCVTEKEPGLHSGRHRGMKEAKAEILVFADDDIEAFPTWLSAVYKNFDDSSVALVGGKCLPKFESEPPHWLQVLWQERGGVRMIASLSVVDFGDNRKEIHSRYVFGCNFAVRKSFLFSAGGFHPDGMPIDKLMFRGDGETHVSDEVMRRGFKAFYDPAASVYHRVSRDRMTLSYFHTRAFAQGISNSYEDLRAGKVSEHKTYVQTILFLFKKFQIRTAWKMIKQCIRDGVAECVTHDGKARGYTAHQKEYARDAVLHDWVHRETYLDENKVCA